MPFSRCVLAVATLTAAQLLQTSGAPLYALKAPRACEVTLQYPISHTQCQEGINYGCYETNNSVFLPHTLT